MPVALEPEIGLKTTPDATAAKRLPACVIFLSAFLLFQLQPVTAKMVLPWFGGSAAVWTTCVVFFQTLLFLGYLYAHWLVEHVRPRNQALIHGGLLLLSLLVLPVIPSESWKPSGNQEPLLRMLGLLSATVGLPYFLLSATSPLVQAWMTRRGMTALPYRFYALSNLASLLALLAYPVLVEPMAPTRWQAGAWSLLYVAYAGLIGWLAFRGDAPAAETPSIAMADGEAPRREDRLRWLILAALPSALSLAVTTHLCQNVAPIPFLWVLPLGVYLLSLILCFDSDGWYRRPVLLPLQAAALGGAAWLLLKQTPETPVRLVIPAYTAALFVFCMFLHGELARRKPAPRYLTHFYLMLSLGGMIGGLLVSVGAPYLLSGYYEFPLALGACALVTLMLEYRKDWLWDIVWSAAAIFAFVVAMTLIVSIRQGTRALVRNFYGGLRVVDYTEKGPALAYRTMVHGQISHGFQYLMPQRRMRPTTYYSPGSGAGQVIEQFRRPGMRVGVVGLGAGTLAAYGRSGESYRFYELNPQVEALARRDFTFLEESKAETEVVLGDGRLSLEREPERRFDVLVVDAFSGDSIPVHLLTREAVAMYWSHLNDDGALALHISNTALNLYPVVEAVAASLGKDSLRFHATPVVSTGQSESDWILIATRGSIDRRPVLRTRGKAPTTGAGFPVWTDDYSNLFRILK